MVAECCIEYVIIFPVMLKLQLWLSHYSDSMKHLANYVIRATNPLNSEEE